MSFFFGPSSLSSFSSMGRPWQSQPGTYGASKPIIDRERTTTSFRTLLSAVPRCTLPLAYGGPSWRMKTGDPRRWLRSFRYRSMASQCASICGSVACRFAFIGKLVFGRLRESFQSAMVILIF